MHSTETINQFLNPRAQGWTFARIADHLHSKPLPLMRSHFFAPIFLPKPPGPCNPPRRNLLSALKRFLRTVRPVRRVLPVQPSPTQSNPVQPGPTQSNLVQP